MVLGFVCILLGGAAYALPNWNKVDETRSAHVTKTVPRIKSGWDYRPRQAIRRYAAVDSARVETADVLSPKPFTINKHTWLPEGSYINAEIRSSLQSAHLHSSKV